MRKQRARDLGIPFEGTTGPLNAITDVEGVLVGHCTLIEGSGNGAIRTGVTAILARGRENSFQDPVFGAFFSLNGWGEVTGTLAMEEMGFLPGPLLLTNTLSVGVVRDAIDEWAVTHGVKDFDLHVVGETSDEYLNDIHGFHVRKEHAFNAIESASGGEVAEGSVGGGTGMVCYGFKGGIGTSSRIAETGVGTFKVGVLVQANHGATRQLVVAGVPVGLELAKKEDTQRSKSSIIAVIATDAPLLPHQLKRIAKRATHGLARTGAISGNGSGDIFVAFSTANRGAGSQRKELVKNLEMLPNQQINPVFEATIQATEESIINAMLAAETMSGFQGRVIEALPKDRLIQILKRYNRIR